MEWITDPEIWASLATLTVLEVVLGIDNIVFISILTHKLPEGKQSRARRTGLGLALITRVLLLLSINWIMSLTQTWIDFAEVFGEHHTAWMDKLEFSGRDIILFVGGLFLIYKSTTEIHGKMEGKEHGGLDDKKKVTFLNVIIQVLLLDVVFSLDSVITAVGMANEIAVMIAAVVIAVIVMMISSDSISNFVNNHPTVKMLALAFLLLIGVSLTAEAFDQHIPKGYIYFAMSFSVFVEVLNLKSKKSLAVVPEIENDNKNKTSIE